MIRRVRTFGVGVMSVIALHGAPHAAPVVHDAKRVDEAARATLVAGRAADNIHSAREVFDQFKETERQITEPADKGSPAKAASRPGPEAASESAEGAKPEPKPDDGTDSNDQLLELAGEEQERKEEEARFDQEAALRYRADQQNPITEPLAPNPEVPEDDEVALRAKSLDNDRLNARWEAERVQAQAGTDGEATDRISEPVGDAAPGAEAEPAEDAAPNDEARPAASAAPNAEAELVEDAAPRDEAGPRDEAAPAEDGGPKDEDSGPKQESQPQDGQVWSQDSRNDTDTR